MENNLATPLWQPSAERIAQSNITAFIKAVKNQWNVSIPDYPALYRWSIAEPEKFWVSVWDFGGIVAQTRGNAVLENGDKMPGATWFPQAHLNFSENLLKRRADTLPAKPEVCGERTIAPPPAPDRSADAVSAGRDNAVAVVFWGEDKVKRSLTFAELYGQVSRTAQALRAAGVSAGDRVAGYLPNMPETVIAMLAAVSIGAIWSLCSPDFGVQGVLDRFGQIEPKVLFSADGYYYNGKTLDSLERLGEIAQKLPSVERVVIVPYTRETPPVSGIRNGIALPDFIAAYPPREIRFEQLPFSHPLYIMYSSGTTGVPKCIVHGAGGTLMQHLKEHLLHVDEKLGDRLFYFTTCGWMMWNWLVSGLAAGATLMLYDGSPFYPNGNILFDYIDAEGITIFGTSAKYIDAVNKQGFVPMQTHRLSTLKAILSTGSPLVPEGFEFVYRKIKQDVCLSSISGGTDIISCFALGNPVLPVWSGELQSRGLGMKVEVFDDNGHPVVHEKGELVCTAPFPSMPIGFWNDPKGEKYHAAYFERFPNVWCHGDYVELTEHDGVVIYGRSDAVLNPGGVRIGTAEIYRQVEQLDEVVESLVIGQDWDNDVRVVLFVRLKEGLKLDPALTDKIKRKIRENTTPRHVPAKIVQVTDIPRTKSGNIVELAVRNVVHNRPVKNVEALANPETLELFKGIPELKV